MCSAWKADLPPEFASGLFHPHNRWVASFHVFHFRHAKLAGFANLCNISNDLFGGLREHFPGDSLFLAPECWKGLFLMLCSF